MSAGLFMLTGVLTYLVYLVVNEVDERFKLVDTFSKEINDILDKAAGTGPYAPNDTVVNSATEFYDYNDQYYDDKATEIDEETTPKIRRRIAKSLNVIPIGKVRKSNIDKNNVYFTNKSRRDGEHGLIFVKKPNKVLIKNIKRTTTVANRIKTHKKDSKRNKGLDKFKKSKTQDARHKSQMGKNHEIAKRDEGRKKNNKQTAPSAAIIKPKVDKKEMQKRRAEKMRRQNSYGTDFKKQNDAIEKGKK